MEDQHRDIADFRNSEFNNEMYAILERRKAMINKAMGTGGFNGIFFINVFNAPSSDKKNLLLEFFNELSIYFRGENERPFNLCNLNVFTVLDFNEVAEHPEIVSFVEFYKQHQEKMVMQHVSISI